MIKPGFQILLSEIANVTNVVINTQTFSVWGGKARAQQWTIFFFVLLSYKLLTEL